ncbi:hypothetical protein AKJ16_DCAP12962 [Drosera capensis]
MWKNLGQRSELSNLIDMRVMSILDNLVRAFPAPQGYPHAKGDMGHCHFGCVSTFCNKLGTRSIHLDLQSVRHVA